MSPKRRKFEAFYNSVVVPWVTGSGVCDKCGRSAHCHSHHILTRGAHPELFLCPSNLLCLCEECHGCAHNCIALFSDWLGAWKPGLRSWLKLTESPKCHKLPLSVWRETYLRMPERAEFWRHYEVAS